MNVNLKNLQGMESDFEKMKVSTEAGGIYQIKANRNTRTQNAISVDLGSSLFNDNAYGEGLKTTGDIRTEAQNTESSIRHNYMSVMANTLSPEDFAKGAEEGFDFSETNSEETVTILDKIKASLLQSGKEIVGFTDDLSASQLEKITGSKALSENIASSFYKNDIPITKKNVSEVMDTMERMSEVTELDEQALKYMTLNELEPTMENIYMARHATNGLSISGRGFIPLETGGYLAQKADTINWDSIKDQAEKIVEEADLSPDEENLEKARWMIEQSIPLTKENIKTVDTLSKIKLPMEQNEIIESAAKAIANKNSAGAGLIQNPENNLEKAISIVERTKELNVDDAEQAVAQNKPVTLQNLFEIHEKEISNNKKDSINTERELIENQPADLENKSAGQDREALIARKNLEEVRLKMTVNVSLKLVDKGFSIETAPIEDLIKKLDLEIKELEKTLFPTDENEIINSQQPGRYLSFENITTKVEMFNSYPAALVGRISEDDKLGGIFEKGDNLKLSYQKMNMTYEAVGTAPRADLGDNIKKAFRNVDDILKDLGEEITDENRRVLRILGYNRMEISSENIEKVRTTDEKLMRTIERLKPSAVLSLIREKKNPLNMTLDELSNELSGHDNDSSKREEKYAKFLYKLEKNAEITSEEKQSYIGIFRLFANLKKTDNAAIGTVLETGAEMTIGNLLSAQRTIKTRKSGMDVLVDDTLKRMESLQKGTMTIDSQIEQAFRYYSEKADIVYQNLEPEKLVKIKPDEETLLDELANKVSENENDEKAEEIQRQYYSEQTKLVRRVTEQNDFESTAEELKEYGIEITASNIEALMRLRQGRRGRNSIWSDIEKAAHLSFKETEQEMLDSLGEDVNFEDIYEDKLSDLADKLDEILTDENGPDTYIDIKAIHLMKKQISVAGKMAERGSFDIPVEVDGRTVSMHVTLKESSLEGTKVEAAIETQFYGKISMAMTVEDKAVKGVFASNLGKDEEISEYLSDVRDRFSRELSINEPDLFVDSNNIGIMYRRQEAGSAVQGAENGISDSRFLLRMAGVFVHVI